MKYSRLLTWYDPKDTVKIVKQFVEENNITMLPWSLQSSDVNPIENLWNEIKRSILQCNSCNTTTFSKASKREWSNIPIEPCRSNVVEY